MDLASYRPNILRFNNVLSLNEYGLEKLLNSTFLGSATPWAQVHMGLISCQTQRPWVQLCAEPK
jgi:hypothetical protein